jgi:WD40 repeat protein
MVAASLEFESGRYSHAWELLHDAPEAPRKWEWHLLRCQIDPSLRLFSDRLNNVCAARLVRGSDMLRTIDTDGTVRLWHRWTGREADVRRVQYGNPMMLGPEGNLVLSGGDVPTLWDARTGQVLRRFDASLNASVRLSAISTGGAYVAIHGRGGVLKLIDTKEGRLLRSFPSSRCKPHFSVDGAWLVWRDRDSIRFWDVAANREPRPALHLGSDKGSNKLSISPDRTYVAWKSGRQLRLWDLKTGDHDVLHPVPHAVDDLMFNDASTRLVSTLFDGAIQLWETATAELLNTLHSPGVSTVTSQSVNCEGRLLMTHAMRPGWHEIRLWDLEGSDSLVLKGHTSFVYPVAVSPDGKRVASGAWDGTVRLWDVETSEQLAALRPGQGAIYSLAFDSRGERLAAATADYSVFVWNQATGQLVDRVKLTDKCYSLAFTPDDAKLVVAHGGLTVLDGKPLMPQQALVPQHFPGEKDHVTEVVFSPSRDSFVTFSGKSSWAPGREVSVWDVSTLKQLAVFQAPTPVNTATYSPDGARLALGHADGQLTVWDLADLQRPVTKMQTHTRGVFALQYLSNGSRLLSGGRDGKIRIWDMRSHGQLCVLSGHTDYVYSLALSPDGQRLVSGSGDHTVRIWETFPLSRRLNSRRQAESLRPQAERLVDRLMADESDMSRVVQRIGENNELSATLRREMLNVALRLAVGEPSS